MVEARPVPAASLLLLDQHSRVLLVKRGAEPYAGYWGFPGGRIEQGEDSLSAALRELCEETGVVGASIEGLAGIAEVYCSDYHFIILVYWGRSGDTNVRASSDAVDARWFSRDKALSIPLTPSTRAFLFHWKPGKKIRVSCNCGDCHVEPL